MPAAPAPFSLPQLNAAPRAAFVATLADVVEHSPWVAEAVAEQRPFASAETLHAAMLACIRRASPEEQVALLRLHPELAGREAGEGTLTEASTSEQGRLGLTALSPDDHARLRRLNAAYAQKFGFPFITAVRLHPDLASIFRTLETSLLLDPEAARARSLAEIGEIMRGRLDRLLGEAPAGTTPLWKA
jgi:2-oxo-4-hydroxy-4-carboxy-5-ureidoimidazoline decarboxylase